MFKQDVIKYFKAQINKNFKNNQRLDNPNSKVVLVFLDLNKLFY